MDVAIVPVFGAHCIGMVGSGEVAPIRNELEVVCGKDAFAEVVEILHGRNLHGVGEPSR